MKKYFLISVLCLLFTTKTFALGDGPRVFWAVPEGTNVVTPMWIGMDSNSAFYDSFIVPNANFNTDITVLMYTHALSMDGNLGSISVIVPGGRLDGELGDTALQGKSSGLGDITIMGVMSLTGAPAYSKENFASYKPETIVDLLVAVTAPTGEYDPDNILNMNDAFLYFRTGSNYFS